MNPRSEKGLLHLAKKALAVITASMSSLMYANSTPIINEIDLNSIKENDIEKFRLKILKPQLVLKQNPNNLSAPFLAMHTSHRSHSSHSSHSSHVSSSSSRHNHQGKICIVNIFAPLVNRLNYLVCLSNLWRCHVEGRAAEMK